MEPDPLADLPPAQVTDAFHRLWYDTERWRESQWMGTTALKCPFDLWVYQELIFELEPDLIVETGTAFGGSARYLATMLDLCGNGEIVTIDVEAREDRPSHPRVTYLLGSSVADEVVAEVHRRAEGARTVMVLLDSDHRAEHVLAELRAYSPLVTPGSYLVVEDTNVIGRPVYPSFGPVPGEATEAFLAESDLFEVDRSKEKFLLTFNPGGWLKRKT
ncbi:MAG: CmcI family methyltransferase [Acidimicrobiales bacterium]